MVISPRRTSRLMGRDEGILGERAMVTITATRLMEQLGQ
jgi:hypothetical protein